MRDHLTNKQKKRAWQIEMVNREIESAQAWSHNITCEEDYYLYAEKLVALLDQRKRLVRSYQSEVM